MLARRPHILLAALLVGAVSCAPRPRAASTQAHRNLLVITLDTTRPDHLGSYGYAAAQTPRLDALAASGVRFTQAVTVTPLTLPAHSSLFTGTFPAHHGVRDNGGFYLGDEQTTLAEVLKARGYRTGAFVGAFVLDGRWGLKQGFDRYRDEFELSGHEGGGLDSIQRRGDDTVAKAGEWLDQDRDKPFFCWVHLYDPHAPYEAPEPYRSRYPATMTGAYDAEVAWTDSLVGTLLDRLGARAADTVVVALGDHGESLGEHEEQAHGFFVYDATVRIPLMIAGPGVAPAVSDRQVRILDVMPTALGLLGVPVPSSVQGQALLPAPAGTQAPLLALAETFYPRYHYGWSELQALRDGRYKYVDAPRPELYDLRDDPGEIRDLAGAAPDRVAALSHALAEMRTRITDPTAAAGPKPMDAETEQRLQALGYVGGTLSSARLQERPRGDPKDKIGLYNLLKRAGSSSVEGRYDEAIATAQRALAADPDIVEAYTLVGNVHSKEKRWDRAAIAYKAALARDPEHRGAAFGLALAYKQLGQLKDAEAGFERMRTLDPRAGKPLWQLADIRMQQGRLQEARLALEEGLNLDVDRPAFLLKLGECLIEEKRFPEAAPRVQEALRLKPDLAGGHFDLGLLAEARGDAAGAQREYEAEAARDPGAFRARFNLARLLMQSGRPADAVPHLRAAVGAEDGFGTGWLYLAKALLDTGDTAGAEGAARKGLQRHPEAQTAPLGHYVLADVYTRLGRPRDAAREAAAAERPVAGAARPPRSAPPE